MTKQNAALKILVKLPLFFIIALFFIASFERSSWYVFFFFSFLYLALGCPLDSEKGVRMRITAGAKREASRWLTQTGEIKTLIKNLTFV